MKKTEKMLKSSNLKSNLNEKTNQNPSVAIYKKERGITLIALVVTIVVLIILATISINAILGENGIISRAEQARQHQANAEASDNAAMDELVEHLANAMGENGGSTQTPTDPENPEGGNNPPPTIKEVTLDQAKENDMLTATENAKLTIGQDTVWIPAGFKVHAESANTVNGGIVITDGTNEFVWVPVDETSFNAMFGTSNTELALCGSTNVTTNYYSNLRVQSGDSSLFATTPGTTSVTVDNTTVNGVREPDLVVGSGGTSYDASTSTTYYSQAGFTSTQAMAQAFVTDYTNMRASIQKYDGFYIGRYELTGTVESPTVQAGAVLTASSSQAGNWYGLYKACRNVVKDNEKVTSTMIWGCQWDETMNWLSTCGYNVDSDSTSWGNYSNSSGNAQVKESDGTTNAYGKKQNTGYSKEYWSANNICDLAGNYYEWTQEAYRTDLRVYRGRLLLQFRFLHSSLSSQRQQSERRLQQRRFL